MNVVAIRCEACQGKGKTYLGEIFFCTQVWQECGVCNGTGTERPPQDHDRNARRDIEGKTDEQ